MVQSLKSFYIIEDNDDCGLVTHQCNELQQSTFRFDVNTEENLTLNDHGYLKLKCPTCGCIEPDKYEVVDVH